MASALASFGGIARRAASRAAVQVFARPFAANADLAALSDDKNTFMQFTTPEPQSFAHSSILAAPATRVTTLANGMRVATETTAFAETATVGVWIDAGSRYETVTTNGTAHFLEHMAFKGTKTRTTAGLEEEVENLGAHLNAYTSREQTTYYAKVFKQDVPKAVDILSDILLNSELQQSHIERERGVILREMEEVEKELEEVLFDHLHATAFQQTGLGRTILGPAENVRSITKANLADYIKTHYTAPRMVLVGTGAVDHDELVAAAEKAFGGLPTAGADVKTLVKEDPAHFTGSDVRIRDDDMTTTSFCVAFQGASWTSPDAVPLMVMQAMLGSWDKHSPGAKHAASPLAARISSNNLANSFMAFNTNYSDTGLFGVHVSTDAKAHLDDVAFCVMMELQDLIYDPKAMDVTRAKQALKASLLLHSESSSSAAAEEIGRQLLTYGRRIPRAELFARIDAVTPETVKATAWKYIRDQCPAIAAIGPTQMLPDYNWFRGSTYNNFY
eukprot:CAMPEP_0197592636 /NCGR_PEP_ID=MMETSP1326-20131121/15199_1 /TAXON_ID=1155430 /ORGANISM="Genus nov. species nov., Strain RCC2288" /LENGTH=502 /DNA_ID=CAMNT_0043158357 /DNA_START=31 /DNA_END=1539 /DNA_ORIENTATION=+